MNDLSPQARQIAARTGELAPQIAPHVTRTALLHLGAASEATGARLLLKCEHQQRTGSFKLRGALAALLTLGAAGRGRGVVTYSTGNHGLGVACALSELGGTGVVCVPEQASPVKVAAIRRYGIEVRELGSAPEQTEALARQLAQAEGMTYVSPYNDPDVIAGQGTVGAEIIAQSAASEIVAAAGGGQPPDVVVAAVGGGGLISGVAATVKLALPGLQVIGASPAGDAAMAASVRAGRVVGISARPTISDGTAGGVEDGAVTLPLCAELVDEWLLIDEPDICAALRLIIDTEHQLIEGAAATAVAAGLQAARSRPGQTIAIVSCGANISAATLATALAGAW